MVVDLLRDVQEAVSHLRRHHVCHLDIKQANVIVGQDNVLSLTDFGFAENIAKPVMYPCGIEFKQRYG